MDDRFKIFTDLGHAVLRKVRLSNALGAPIAVLVVVTLPCLLIFWATQAWILLVIGALPVIYFIRAYDYLMKNNPSMLHTEEHEERMLEIQVGGMGTKKDQISETAADTLTPVAAKSEPQEAEIVAGPAKKEKEDKK